MKNKVLVIGAGISGIYTAVKLVNNNYDVTLIDKNHEIGGLIKGSIINGFNVDKTFHWVMGTKDNTYLNNYWRYIGGFTKDTKFIHYEDLIVINYEDKTIRFNQDMDKSENEWIKDFPEDSKEIKKFFSLMRLTRNFWSYAQTIKDKEHIEVISLAKNIPELFKAMKCSREEYATRFKSPALRFAFKYAQTGYNSIFFFGLTYGAYSFGDAGVPEGGSYVTLKNISEYLSTLPIKVILDTKVDKVIENEDKSLSVIYNNESHNYDYVISALDINYTLSNLLDNKYHVPLYDKLKKNINEHPIASCFNVFLAIKDVDKKYIGSVVKKIESIKIGRKDVDGLLIRFYNYDKAYQKDGYTIVSLFIDQDHDDYHYYKSLDKHTYQKVFIDNVNKLISTFLKLFPQYKEYKYLCAFSPIEIGYRSNNNYGALLSYSFVHDNYLLYNYNGKIKGLKNFYNVSQWSRPIGGTPSALISAEKVTNHFIKVTKKELVN